MKKEIFIDLFSFRKVALIILFSIILLSFCSCSTLIDALLGNSTCIEPGCDRDTSGNSSYCILHSDKEVIEVDTSNPYKLHKPLSEEEMMKTKVKIKRKTY